MDEAQKRWFCQCFGMYNAIEWLAKDELDTIWKGAVVA
jgi:hypothetical protein